MTIGNYLNVLGVAKSGLFNIDQAVILLNMELPFFLYDIKVYKSFVYVITELEVFKINISSLEIAEVISLPSFYKQINLGEHSTEIECIEGEILTSLN